ncbi:hypothetical protein TREMEDRAFT_44978 [Tremella mesenterica DSM 1558]|uniref:uncharacterized protein n=1 Tax=Tremella mesenterica (strain ATCC 24925 / CBS 8224 / DSM 1558 / NBRC 9311 / NRRL Y-6157 / RJB 2259-6 / UBC 559-6) TaxID=578456 RepID=UPI0003F4A551|nr:uncharacterized protein TREMEDRAFT_44978 [Tremella mesenterica DSM 1558]EIW68002.1 hypothetical protein TREMEDRAFT_44978 [Tremella mesenterica DSM 1558]
MANASSKRIVSANETALKNLRLGFLIVNLSALILRLILSRITSRSAIPRLIPVVLQIGSFVGSLSVWRWFVLISTPRIGSDGKVRSGEDLGGKGVVELAWDLIYMTWICTLGSALLGEWIWWLMLLIPIFGTYKAFYTLKPLLGMFLPSLFGPRSNISPDPETTKNGSGTPGESKKQAKLRVRAEKGDKRVQQRKS